jgi:hypothetical protein
MEMAKWDKWMRWSFMEEASCRGSWWHKISYQYSQMSPSKFTLIRYSHLSDTPLMADLFSLINLNLIRYSGFWCKFRIYHFIEWLEQTSQRLRKRPCATGTVASVLLHHRRPVSSGLLPNTTRKFHSLQYPPSSAPSTDILTRSPPRLESLTQAASANRSGHNWKISSTSGSSSWKEEGALLLGIS